MQSVAFSTLRRPLAARMQGAASRLHLSKVQTRGIITIKDELFSSKATAEGAGRNGHVKSFGDVPLDLKLSMPKSVGGKGDGQNPEQLFAMGYSACFLGALQHVATKAGKKKLAEHAKVNAVVTLGNAAELEGFALRVKLTVEGCEDEGLIEAAHEFCPYSRALKHGVDVTVSKA